MKLSPGLLMGLFPNANPTATDALARGAGTLERYGINTPERAAHFLAQLAHETGGFQFLEERGKYTPERLRQIFPRQFESLSRALDYSGDAIRTLSRAYANRMGNGDENTQDGYRFRGRGFIQLTGRHNYETYSKKLDVDLVGNPDQAKTGDVALKIACAYWDKLQLNKYADIPSNEAVKTISRGVNLGNPQSSQTPNGLADRITKFHTILEAIRAAMPVEELKVEAPATIVVDASAPAPASVEISNTPSLRAPEIDWAIGGGRIRAAISAIVFAWRALTMRLAK